MAAFVLVVGVLALFAALNIATDTTRANRERQAENSLARAVIEDTLTLPYTQLTPQLLAGALQPLLTGSTISAQGLVVIRSIYTFNVSVSNVCSLDDPTDGIGNHTNPPASGGQWCPDVGSSGTTDTNPDDEKRLTVVVTPSTGTLPTVKLSTLIRAGKGNGPAVSCLTTAQGACPGTNQTITNANTASLTFFANTTTSAQSIQWLVNGGPPPSAQIPTGATDPYAPSGTSSQFTWTLPQADGTYTITALAQDSLGNTGSRSTLQITLNRHPVIPPANPPIAGYDQLFSGGYTSPTGGVDIQWQPSVDQDVLYYDVYRKVGTNSPVLVCSHITGTTCTDTTAPDPGQPANPCSNPPTDYVSQPSNYYVTGWDTYSTGSQAGQPREGGASALADADKCDNPPAGPSGLTVTASGGSASLNWTAPSPQDPDPGDSIMGWRIYRWPSGANVNYQTDRLAYVAYGQTVTSFTDSSADPGGVVQNYCVTSVDTRLNESPCSNTQAG